MSAFPKADIQNIGVGIVSDGCLWPKADIQTLRTDGAEWTNLAPNGMQGEC